MSSQKPYTISLATEQLSIIPIETEFNIQLPPSSLNTITRVERSHLTNEFLAHENYNNPNTIKFLNKINYFHYPVVDLISFYSNGGMQNRIQLVLSNGNKHNFRQEEFNTLMDSILAGVDMPVTDPLYVKAYQKQINELLAEKVMHFERIVAPNNILIWGIRTSDNNKTLRPTRFTINAFKVKDRPSPNSEHWNPYESRECIFHVLNVLNSRAKTGDFNLDSFMVKLANGTNTYKSNNLFMTFMLMHPSEICEVITKELGFNSLIEDAVTSCPLQ